MKRMYGKLGLGLAGAIATVGLMSAGVQMANAQLVMSPPGTNYYPGSGNPYISSATAGDDTWAYVLGLENPSNSGSTNVYLIDNGTYQGTFTIDGFSGYISGSAVIPTGWSVGYLSNNLTLTYYSGPTITVAPGGFVSLGTFYFGSIYGPSAIGTFTSMAATGSSTLALSPDTNTTNTQVPDASTPAAPLPLPPEFWPSVLTLAGMAAVGGLRLRNRAL